MQSEISKNLIVTGSNRGLGLAFVRMVCEKSLPYNVICTARYIKAGQERISELKSKYPNTKLFFHQLDILNAESIKAFSKWFGENYRTLDILVNNAGVGVKSDIYATKLPTEDVMMTTLSTNFYGVINTTESLLSHLTSNGKIVNVSSIMGTLDKHEPKIKKLLLDSSLTTEKLIEIAKDYEKQVKNQKLDGWSISAYSVSKSLVTAYTRFALKKVLKEKQMAIAVHPGWCRTDMGGPTALCSDEDGADKIFHAAFQANEEKDNFHLFIDKKIFED